ncbi:unnamed protein product [Closterium sp. NIES-54]
MSVWSQCEGKHTHFNCAFLSSHTPLFPPHLSLPSSPPLSSPTSLFPHLSHFPHFSPPPTPNVSSPPLSPTNLSSLRHSSSLSLSLLHPCLYGAFLCLGPIPSLSLLSCWEHWWAVWCTPGCGPTSFPLSSLSFSLVVSLLLSLAIGRQGSRAVNRGARAGSTGGQSGAGLVAG